MRTWVLVGVLVLLVGVAVFIAASGGFEGDTTGSDAIHTTSLVSGKLTSLGGPFGDYQIQPSFCRSGGYASNKRSRFGGAALHANSPQQGIKLQAGSIEVRTIGEEDGKQAHQVRILAPGRCRDPEDWYTCKGPVLHARDCSRFDVTTRQGRRVSMRAGIYAYSGHARLACKLADGTQIEATIAFQRCD